MGYFIKKYKIKKLNTSLVNCIYFISISGKLNAASQFIYMQKKTEKLGLVELNWNRWFSIYLKLFLYAIHICLRAFNMMDR